MNISSLACSFMRKHATVVIHFVHLALKLTTLPCEIWKSFLSAVYNNTTMSEMSLQLLRRFPKYKVGFIFCTDEKIFTITTYEHANRTIIFILSRSEGVTLVPAIFCVFTYPTFIHSVIVSVAISKLSRRTADGVTASHLKHC